MEHSILNVLLTYGGPFLLGVVGGGVSYLFVGFGIGRRFRRLAVRLSDLEERYMSLQGRAAVNKRWQANDWERELAESVGKARAPKQRFDNDPPEF